ncbi:MAG TPA: spermidine synthase, partial [Syntrophaceae bacterium]|nr:spermidine synthase [Syntrophaceae bacterium]
MMENLRDSGWLCEYDGPYEARILKVKESILSVKTKYQRMELVETYAYGKALFLDEKIQCSELDGFIYHEALVMPSLIIHPDPKRILIIGGGDGFTLRQVLQLKGIDVVVMIDIDREVVLAAKEHLSFFHKDSFLDPKVKLKFGDGRKYLEDTNQIFDVII